MPLKLNSFVLLPTSWRIPKLSDFCGGEELAHVLLDRRRHHREDEGWRAPISDVGLSRLVKLAYHASQASEEGEMPRFRVANYEVRGTSSTTLARFAVPPVLSAPRDLARLSPACIGRDQALVVVEKQSELQVFGICDVGPMGFNVQPGAPGVAYVGSQPSLELDVRGPGHLIANEVMGPFELREGRIRQLVPLDCVPAIREMVGRLAKSIDRSVKAQVGHDGARFYGGTYSIERVIEALLSEVVRIMLDRGRGGNLLITPEEPASLVQLKYQTTSLSVRDMIEQYFCACIEYQLGKAEGKGTGSDLQRTEWARKRMLAAVETVASLSLVDGCVWLAPDLTVRGFGGEIRAKEPTARPLKNIKTGQVVKLVDALRQVGGTRHKSALRACGACGGSISIVVSQDQTLRVFTSDEANTFGFEALSPELSARAT